VTCEHLGVTKKGRGESKAEGLDGREDVQECGKSSSRVEGRREVMGVDGRSEVKDSGRERTGGGEGGAVVSESYSSSEESLSKL